MKQRIHALTGLIALSLASFASSARSEEIIIGVPMALTGPYAFAGVSERNGVALAFEQANKTNMLGAGNSIKPSFQDTGSDKTQAITLVSQFATREKALMIVGYSSSIEAIAAAAVANQLEIPMIGHGSSNDILKAGPWSFRIPTLFDVSEVLGQYMATGLKAKTAAVVYVRDNTAMVAQKNSVAEALKKGGVNVVSDDGVLPSESDFTSLATRLASVKPDAIYINLPSEQAASFVIQMRQAGLPKETKITGMAPMAASMYISTGGSAVEGSVAAADYFVGSKSELNKKFVADYRAKYNIDPDNYAALGYTAAQVALNAIKAAGPNPTRQKVRDELVKTRKMPTVLGNGEFNFDDNREPHYGAAFMKVENKGFIPLE